MKVILLSDSTWSLVQAKIKAEFDCARNAVDWARAYEIQYNLRHHNMARIRKRRKEASRMCREILSQ